jgi:hypothetical protein
MEQAVKLGSRVFLRNCIAGEPGCVVGWNRNGRAEIFWPDLYTEMGRHTFHAVDTLIVDEAFKVEQLGLFEEIAA